MISTMTVVDNALNCFVVIHCSHDLRNFNCKAILLEPGGFKTPGATKEVFAGSFSKAWAGAPSEVKVEYGQEYANYCESMFPHPCISGRPNESNAR